MASCDIVWQKDCRNSYVSDVFDIRHYISDSEKITH